MPLAKGYLRSLMPAGLADLSLDEAAGHWRVDLDKAPPLRGWYLVELAVDFADARKLDLFLVAEQGDGEPQRINFPLRNGRAQKRVVWFAPDTADLRLAWGGSGQPPGLLRFRLVRLPALVGRYFMHRRLHQRHRAHQQSGHWLATVRPLPAETQSALHHRFQRTFVPHDHVPDYQDWIDENDDHGPASCLTRPGAMARQPRFSLLLPLARYDVARLQRLLDSLQQQTYGRWELCIACPAGMNSALERLADDQRVRVVASPDGTETLPGAALARAGGDFIALLGGDDTLAPDALLAMAMALNDHPDWQVVYSDDDRVAPAGRRHHPHFKPDWNPEQLRSHDYIQRLCILAAELVERAGGLDAATGEAQEYDLLLRCTALAGDERIGHIPRVLYHHHAPADISDRELAASLYPGEAGRAALQKRLQQDAPGSRVRACPEQYGYRVDYPHPRPLVSLIIPTRDHHAVLRTCIDSILSRTGYPNYEILVVDNQSSDPATLAYLEELAATPRIRLLRYDRPFNYSAINNFAAAQAKGEIIGLLNNDTEVIGPDWLDEMVSLACQPASGCIGARLYYPDETIQHAGVILGLGRLAGHGHRDYHRGDTGYFNRIQVRHQQSAVTAACLLVRKSVFDEVGGLDEAFEVAFNDVDFCIRVQQAGYRNIYTPFAELFHHESKSRGLDDTPQKQARFNRERDLLRQRWAPLLDNDPYYNPNLTRLREDFSLAQPHEP